MSAPRKVPLLLLALPAVKSATSAESGDTSPATALKAALVVMEEVATVVVVVRDTEDRKVVVVDSVDPDRPLATRAAVSVT